MTRKFLGTDYTKTISWLSQCKNCTLCFGWSNSEWPFSLGKNWSELQGHIWKEHADNEFCLDCHEWLDDTVFAEHLRDRHDKIWVSINSPLYKELL